MDYEKSEDKFFKSFLGPFLNILFWYMGYDFKYKKILPNEIVINGTRHILDLLIETTDGTLINLEFMSTKLTKKDKIRFHTYALAAEEKYHKPVYTIVISTYEQRNRWCIHQVNRGSIYAIRLVTFKELSAKRILKEIKKKIENNEILNEYDLFYLGVIPFARYDGKIDDVLEKACKITNDVKVKDDELLHCIKSTQILSVQKFVKKASKKRKLNNVIRMTDEVFFEMFVKEPYENGHKDGKEEGKQENKIENAINLLKNGVSIEIITESLKLTQKDLQIIKAAK